MASGVLLPLRGLSAFERHPQNPDGSHEWRLRHQKTPTNRFTSVPTPRRIACVKCLNAAKHRSDQAANTETPRTRPTETGRQELEHLVLRSAMENTICLANICRRYQLLEKLGEYHARWELSRFRQEAAISTPMFEFASDSFPGAANIRNLALNLF